MVADSAMGEDEFVQYMVSGSFLSSCDLGVLDQNDHVWAHIFSVDIR